MLRKFRSVSKFLWVLFEYEKGMYSFKKAKKGTLRVRKKGKLNLRYVRQYEL